MAARASEAPHITRCGLVAFLLAGVLGLSAAACLRARPVMPIVPPTVESLEGYASWKIVRDGASARSRFSFLIVPPDRGLMEITDPLNRTIFRLVIEGETAFLVLPGKHAYWKADRPDIMTKLMGFDINPEELSALLSGREQGLGGWSLKTDDQGRVVGGRRGSLTFLVREFFDGGRLPRTAAFSNGTDHGSLRVIHLRFNTPPREEAFRLSFLDDSGYRAVGWAEIEKLLKDEN